MIHQLKTYGGDTVLLTEKQYQAIIEQYDNGATEFLVGSQRIPRSSISFLGFTDGAAESMRVEEQNYIRTLSSEESKALQEARYKEACRLGARREISMIDSAKEKVWKSIGNPDVIAVIGKEDGRSLPMSAEESENGDAEYYLDGSGNKMFS